MARRDPKREDENREETKDPVLQQHAKSDPNVLAKRLNEA
jgi:hypothetical protein